MLAPIGALPGERLHAPLPDRRRCSPTRSATRSSTRALRPRGLLQRRADRPPQRRDRRARPAARPAGRRRRPAHDARPDGPAGRRTTRSPAAHGAVVALDAETGAVRVMAADAVVRPERLRPNGADDRSTARPRAGYPPGSTIKVVTATAALDSGELSRPTRRVNGENGKEISGVPLDNFGGEDFGDDHLTTALTNSVNTVWARSARSSASGTMGEYMERFGFYEDPPHRLPGRADGAERRVRRRRASCSSPTRRQVDVGRMAIGQDKLLVTPLQMAMVAPTVANGGVLMEPRLVAEGRRPRRPHDRRAAARGGRARDVRGRRAELTAMMRNVVERGHGHRGARSRASRSPARPAPPRSTATGLNDAVVHRLRRQASRSRSMVERRPAARAAPTPRRSPSRSWRRWAS